MTDDGRGFEPEAPVGALGLIVLAERLSLVDGRLAVDSAPGTGTDAQRARSGLSALRRRSRGSEASSPRCSA